MIKLKNIYYYLTLFFVFYIIPVAQAIEISIRGELDYERLNTYELMIVKSGEKIILAKEQGSFITVVSSDKKVKSYSFIKQPELKTYDEIGLNNFCSTPDDKIAVHLNVGKSYAEAYDSLVFIIDLKTNFKYQVNKEHIIDYQNFIYQKNNKIHSICTNISKNINSNAKSILSNTSNRYITFSPDLESLFIQEQNKKIITWNFYKRNKDGNYLKYNSRVVNDKINSNAYLFVKWSIDNSYLLLHSENKSFIFTSKSFIPINLNSLNPNTLICLSNKIYFTSSDKNLKTNRFLIKYDLQKKTFFQKSFNNVVAVRLLKNNQLLIGDKTKESNEKINLDFKYLNL